MGKIFVIIFAAVSLLILPVTLNYIGDPSVDPPNFTLDIEGNIYDAKLGDYGEKGFFFLKFSSSGGNIFIPDTWNQAFTNEVVFGLPTGTFMYILWLVGMGLALIGIIVAFFATKISGIFFLLSALTYGFQAVIWYLGMNIELSADPNIVHFPIPLASLFFLVTAIVAFASKKKEAYYYSPGYSYGYGRR